MSRLIQGFQSLERWYRACHTLYTDTLNMLTSEDNSDIFNVITLSMLKNKVCDGSVNTIKEMLQTRIDDLEPSEEYRSFDKTRPECQRSDSNLSNSSNSNSLTSSSEETSFISRGKPRELKILLTGNVDAGKSSVLNVLMGGAYLPAHNDKTTSVPCEIHNSNERLAQVCFGEDKAEDIELPYDASEKGWSVLREVIKRGVHGHQKVTRLKIFWPFRQLRDESSREKDPEDTPLKQVYGTNQEPDNQPNITGIVLPVVFLDLPGLLDEGATQVLENIPDYHHFVIVIDCSTVIRDTLDVLLKGIANKVAQHGGVFDPTSVMFLLNRCDLLDEDPSGEPREKVILKAIQRSWPIVTARQLHMISCRKMLKGKGDINGFKDTTWNFIELANRRNIEEHCFWLTTLLEGVAAYFGTGYKWLSFDQCLEGIKKHAEADNKYLQNELEKLLNKKSSFWEKLLEAAKQRKQALKKYLTTEMQTAVADALVAPGCDTIRKDYESKKDKLLEAQKREMKKQFKLVENVENDDVSLKNYVDRNEIIVAVGRLVMTHVAVVQVPVRTMEEELKYICRDDPNRERAVVIDLLSDWCERQADVERRKRIELLRVQQDVRRKIINIRPMLQTQSTERHRRLATIADRNVRKLHKIYVEHVLEHEFRGAFEEASKDCFVRYRRGKSPTSGGLPQHTDIYREMIMLRALSTKEKEEQEKKGNFLLLQGTSSLVQEHVHVLAILMERCDVPLNEVILGLHTDRTGWETDGGRKRLVYALGAAKGLQFMHKNGFVHRDVKPHNFLVKSGLDGAPDIVKICAVGHTEEMAKMSPGYGTRGYCAPEVLSAETYSTKSDVYSLGLVLWEMWYCTKITCKPGETPPLEPEPEGVFGIILPMCLDTCAGNRPDCSFVARGTAHGIEGAISRHYDRQRKLWHIHVDVTFTLLTCERRVRIYASVTCYELHVCIAYFVGKYLIQGKN